MTITLHWWMLPLALLLVGFAWACWIARTTDHGGNFPDVWTPFLALCAFGLCAVAALGLVVGHFL